MGKVIPSLSDKGWVTDTETMLAKVLSFYLLTDGAQSLSFQDNLTNLPETYYEHINAPLDMSVAIREDLTKVLGRYFETVEVDTEVKDKGGTEVGILLYASVVDDKGKRVSMGKVLEMNNEGLRKTVDINNHGDGKALLG